MTSPPAYLLAEEEHPRTGPNLAADAREGVGGEKGRGRERGFGFGFGVRLSGSAKLPTQVPCTRPSRPCSCVPMILQFHCIPSHCRTRH